MKRVFLLATAIITFLAGVTVSRLFHPIPNRYAYQYQFRTCGKHEFKPRFGGEYKAQLVSDFKPLRVTLNSEEQPANRQVPYEHRYAMVENVSTIPIRYYVLGFGTNRSNLGVSAFTGENGFTYTSPDLTLGPLMPGEMRVIPIKADAEFSEEAFVWVDYLEFEDGLAWGPNRSHTLRVKR